MICFSPFPCSLAEDLIENLDQLKVDAYFLETTDNPEIFDKSFPFTLITTEQVNKRLIEFINASLRGKRAALIYFGEIDPKFKLAADSLKHRQLWGEDDKWCLLTPRAHCYTKLNLSFSFSDKTKLWDGLRQWEYNAKFEA